MRTTFLDHVPASRAAKAETGHGARHMIHMDDDDVDDDPDEDDEDFDEDGDSDEDDDEEEEEETWQVSAARRSETCR